MSIQPRRSESAIVCPDCGQTVSGLERELRMQLPDDLFKIADQRHIFAEKRIQFKGKDFVNLDRKRYFVRVLLPVQLDIDHEFHFGVWLEVDAREAKVAYDVWESKKYSDLILSGRLANAVPPWGEKIFNADCKATVRDQDGLPFISSSSHPLLSKILVEPWSIHACESAIESFAQ
jgi:hypothetical protein